MSPELIAAVKERLELGYTTDAIRDELRVAGHSESVIEQVLEMVKSVNENSLLEDTRAESVVQIVQVNQLPSASDLFFKSFAFVKKHLNLVIFLAAPFSVMVLLGHFLKTSSLIQQSAGSTLVGLLGIIALVLYLLVIGASLYIVAESPSRSVSFGEAFAWIKKNVWGLLWIYILTALVVYGGLLLFIVPGIIVSFLVYFSQYVYVKEGVHGLDALLRSRDLVKGNWLVLAGRLLLLGLLFFVAFLVLGGVVGLVSGLVGENFASELVFAVILQFVSAGVSLMGLHIGMELYRSLATARPMVPNSEPAPDKWKYRLLAILGIILGVGGFIILVMLLGLSAVSEQEVDTELQQNLFNKERAAELRTDVQSGGVEIGEREITPTE